MRWLVSAMLLLGVACSTLPAPQPTPVPTTPPATPTPEPEQPESVAARFFSAWQAGEYSAMYDLLSQETQEATPRDVFVRRYTNIHNGIGEQSLRATPTGSPVSDAADMAHVPFQVVHTLAIFGEIEETNDLPLVLQPDGWRIAWQPSLIFTGLTSGNTVRVLGDAPKRGRILDRNGKPLADNGSVLAIGVVPGEIKDEPKMLQALSDALAMPAADIKQSYQGGQPGWFMPIAERSASERPDLEAKLGDLPGVALQDKPARVYPLGDAAAHIIGYVGHPTADELRQLSTSGYDETDWIGRAGMEAWAEQRLAGQRGGVIQIADAGGRLVRTIARKPAVPGDDVQVTLDATLQVHAAAALGDKTGSVVLMDPRDNSVLALASRPSFDPNQFVLGLRASQWEELNGPSRPLVLRASESAYPTGSIFKVVTLAAGMEEAGYTSSHTFDCGLDWNGLPGVTLHNWEAQGTLNLTTALTRSCNPAFYEIGLTLDRKDPTLLPGYARAFGLGQPTHTDGVHEVGGTVPDPTWKQQQLGEPWTSGDAVNLAIGQGYLLATPLQMANAYSGLANGGRLRTPVLVSASEPKALGTLPVSQGTLATIMAGLQGVTGSQGTAGYAFQDETLKIAAKTGSAENENPDAHAWFVGFTPPQRPSLLVLVMIEGGQHGGTVAAPIARDLIDFSYPLTVGQ